MACGLVTMELHRGDGSLGVFLGVHAGLAMESIAMCGSEEQKARWLPDLAQMNKLGAFALTEPEHGSDSIALETSARPVKGDGEAGGLGAERPQTVDRPGQRGRPDRRLGPQHRGRPGKRVRRGERIAGLPGPGHRGKGVAALGVAGRNHARKRAGAGREPAARGALVQGHQPGPGHHPEHLRLGGAGPRYLRLRGSLALRAGAAPVRRAAGQLPDDPAAVGIDAGGPHRDAAVLPADRPPGRGLAYSPPWPGWPDAQHPQGRTIAAEARTPRAATASCSTTRSCGTWWTWSRSTPSRAPRPCRRSSSAAPSPASEPSRRETSADSEIDFAAYMGFDEAYLRPPSETSGVVDEQVGLRLYAGPVGVPVESVTPSAASTSSHRNAFPVQSRLGLAITAYAASAYSSGLRARAIAGRRRADSAPRRWRSASAATARWTRCRPRRIRRRSPGRTGSSRTWRSCSRHAGLASAAPG